MTIHFLIFKNTCPQSTLYWPTITHITHTKLRWLININNLITATKHFQKEKRKSHTTQPQDSLWEREWIRKIWEREAESQRERKHHVDEDLLIEVEVVDRGCRPVQAAESRSSPGGRWSHRLTESLSSWPEGPVVVFWELRTFCVLQLDYLLQR